MSVVAARFNANSMCPSPSGNLKTVNGPLLRLRLRFLSFSKHASLSDLKKYGQASHLIMVIQRLEDAFSIICINLCAWLNTGSWKMDLVSRYNNIYEQRDTEMGFCCNVFINSNVFIHMLDNLNVHNIRGNENT
jgi:hypothetical protein